MGFLCLFEKVGKDGKNIRNVLYFFAIIVSYWYNSCFTLKKETLDKVEKASDAVQEFNEKSVTVVGYLFKFMYRVMKWSLVLIGVSCLLSEHNKLLGL